MKPASAVVSPWPRRADARSGLTHQAIHTRSFDFLALTKPRLNLLVLFTTLAGFYLVAPDGLPLLVLSHTLLGTAFVAGGAAALNQVWERETDALMRRTRTRPLPDGRLQPAESTLFGVLLATLGLIELGAGVNPFAALVAAVTLSSYIVLYTPLKRRTWLSTIVGAFPGALPPVIGCVAATGSLSATAIALFGIVFLWQMPHFLAIAWLHREDYARAGIPLLPVVEPDGRSTGRQACCYAAALVPVSLTPAFTGVAGRPYMVIALVLGIVLLTLSARFARDLSTRSARRLFLGSIIYLPLLWGALVANRVWLF